MTYMIAKLISKIFFTVQTPEPPYTPAERFVIWYTTLFLATPFVMILLMILGR